MVVYRDVNVGGISEIESAMCFHPICLPLFFLFFFYPPAPHNLPLQTKHTSRHVTPLLSILSTNFIPLCFIPLLTFLWLSNWIRQIRFLRPHIYEIVRYFFFFPLLNVLEKSIDYWLFNFYELSLFCIIVLYSLDD